MKTSYCSILAVVALAFFCVSIAVRAEDYLYETNNDTITITAYTGASGDVTIPPTIDGLPVVSMGEYAFWNCFYVTNIVIPDSVTSIGIGAFGSTGLTSITIPNSVTSIGEKAFSACTRLTSVKFPNSVTNIEDWTFNYCTSLTSVTIPESVISIGDLAFRDCTSLASVTIPNSVTSIGNEAFRWCGNLTAIVIPESVTTIGDLAFDGCDILSTVTIPDSVTNIGTGAFAECSSMRAITVAASNSVYRSLEGVLFDKSETILLQYPGGRVGAYAIPTSVTSVSAFGFSGCVGLSSVTIPESVTSIGDAAFRFCTSLTDITIPDSVTSVGAWAFGYCTSVTNLTIGNSLSSIEDLTFASCSSLTHVVIGNSVTNIGDSMFASCTSLTRITIPSKVIAVGDWAFQGCASLTGVFFEGNAPNPGGTLVFDRDVLTVYYLPGTTGWSDTYCGRPTALWVLPYPVILTISPNFGIQTNTLGFRISWATNASVVVEASATLVNPVWSSVSTNTLISGSSYFSDPEWKNYPARFYRVRSL